MLLLVVHASNCLARQRGRTHATPRRGAMRAFRRPCLRHPARVSPNKPPARRPRAARAPPARLDARPYGSDRGTLYTDQRRGQIPSDRLSDPPPVCRSSAALTGREPRVIRCGNLLRFVTVRPSVLPSVDQPGPTGRRRPRARPACRLPSSRSTGKCHARRT